MLLEIEEDTIQTVWAWVVGTAHPYNLLGWFYEGTDHLFHLQWRIAAIEGFEPPDPNHAHQHKVQQMPESDEAVIAEINSFARHLMDTLSINIQILEVDGDWEKAMEVLKRHLTVHQIH